MGGGGGASFGGVAGLWRMFNAQVGGQIAWLLPLAGGRPRRRPVADAARPADRPAPRRLVLFGVWALVHVAVFCSQQGIFHPYYVSALAPAVAALAGVGLVTLWRRARARGRARARWRRRSPARPWLAVDAARAHAGLRAVAARRDPGRRRASPCSARSRCGCRRAPRRRSPSLAVAGAFALGAGPASYTRRQPRPRAQRQQRAGRAGERRRRAGSAAAVGRAAAGPPAARRRRRPAAGRRRRRARRRLGQQRADRLPRGPPGLGEVPRRRHRLADHGADHHRDGQGGRDDRRLHRPRQRADRRPAQQMVAKGELKYVCSPRATAAIDAVGPAARHRGERLRRPLLTV